MRLRLHMMPLHGETVRLILSLGLASFAVQAGMAAVNFVLNNLLNMYGAQSPIGAEGALASIGVVQRVAIVRGAAAYRHVDRHPAAARLQLRRAFVQAREDDAVPGASRATRSSPWCCGRSCTCSPRQIVGFFGITDLNLLSFTVFALQVQLFLMPVRGLPDRGLELLPGNGSAGEIGVPVAYAPDPVPDPALYRLAHGHARMVPGLHGPGRAVLRRAPWRTSWLSSPPACSSCWSSSVCVSWRTASCRPSSSGFQVLSVYFSLATFLRCKAFFAV